ncbi:MAG TPA: peptidylprolyl isomerase [Candidatus Thermoplasmatota archaeon]
MTRGSRYPVRALGAVLTLAAAGCGAPDEGTESGELLNPESEAFQGASPETYRVLFETSEGDFTVEVVRAWAPNGADRFYHLVRNGYYQGVRFFRVIEGFMAQFGIHGEPAVNSAWRDRTIVDDRVTQSNSRGTLTYAMRGPDTRTTQLFINFADNTQLDGMGFAPIGRVVEGMDVVDRLHAGYGEGAPRGRGPDQGRMHSEGNAYLERSFPELDFVQRASIVQPGG